jgi:hypothetical protein
LTVLWYDLYPSKVTVDANGKSATRTIRVYSDPASPTPFDQSIVFADFVTGPSGPTSPVGGIPQRGDFFPGDTSLILGTRTIERINGLGDMHLRLDYSRVNWGSIDTFYPGDDGMSVPPYIDLRTTGQKIVTPVPRVVAFPIAVSGPVYSYSVVSEPRTRFQTNITATFHRESWSASDVATAEDLTGAITSDLSVLISEPDIGGGGDPIVTFAADALFTNYNVTRLGENLYRVVYQWIRMPNLPALDEETIDVPGQGIPIRRLAVPAVDAHSSLQVIQRPYLEEQPDGSPAAEPTLVQTEPIDNRDVFLSTELPGLAHASINI